MWPRHVWGRCGVVWMQSLNSEALIAESASSLETWHCSSDLTVQAIPPYIFHTTDSSQEHTTIKSSSSSQQHRLQFLHTMPLRRNNGPRFQPFSCFIWFYWTSWGEKYCWLSLILSFQITVISSQTLDRQRRAFGFFFSQTPVYPGMRCKDVDFQFFPVFLFFFFC